MACGLPVLAPGVGSLGEVVADGDNGRLLAFDPEATLPDRVAEELARWWSDADLMRRLGAAGARRAREVFAPPAFAARVAAVYAEQLAVSSDGATIQPRATSRTA